jgi:hypothetical protein
MKYFQFKYLFVFLVCIWAPLQVFIIKSDGAQRSIGVFLVLALLLNVNKTGFLKIILNPPIIFWAIWIFYVIINTLLKGYSWDLPFYSFLIVVITPLFVLWMINDEDNQNRNSYLNVIVAGLFIRLLLIFLFDTSRSYDEGRFGDKIDSNDFGISAVILIMFLYLKFLYKEFGLLSLISLIAFPIYMIVLSASRNALAGLAILFFAHFIIHRTKDKLTNVIKIIFAGILVYGIFFFFIKSTYLGQRLTETAEQNIEAEYQYDLSGTVFEKFGDRGIFYVQGWALFKENPITGIGLGNYSKYSFEELVLHSEYMIQLCELGVIGSILFLFYYGWIIKSLFGKWKNDQENRRITEAFMFGILIILFMGFSMFQYSNPIYFLLSGFVIANINQKNNQCHYEEKNFPLD